VAVIEKLVRDRIPEIARRRGDRDLFRRAEPHEMAVFLRKKLVEECQALLAADPEDIPDEVADVIEVALAYAEAAGFTSLQCDLTRRKKLEERGGFRQRQVMRLD
jgi:predicted house-cleaning noncanonical NTP pyrophosphatase (MazG superfamily)